MKKVLTVIISAIAFGLIAGLVMVGVNVVATKTGVVSNNTIVSGIEEFTSKPETVVNKATQSVPVRQRNYTYSANYYDDLPDLINDVMPTVVSITNMQKFIENGYTIWGRSVQREYEAPASGSGVIVGMTNDQIIILTNNHVVSSSTGLSVTFNDSKTVDAAIKGTDSAKDLAIISVAKKDLELEILNNIKVSNIGNSDNIRVGEQVVAIGNPLGVGQSVTFGIISAKDREIEELGNSSKLIQIDAAINPGNSGGALINTRGELIGINTAKSSGDAIEGMGYAIPINAAADVIETMSKKKDRETVPEEEQGRIGIETRNISAQTARELDMPEGISVIKINDDSPAKNSELREKDIIVAFDDQNVKTISELQELLSYTRAGQEVSIKVKRLEDGRYVDKEFKITLGKNKVDTKAQKQETEKKQENPQDRGNNGRFYDPFDDYDDFFRSWGNWFY